MADTAIVTLITPDGDLPDASSLGVSRLIAAIRAELVALESEDAEAIEAATSTKLAALQAVQAEVAAGVKPRRALLEEAQTLNAEAALRARAKIVTVEKRLAAVSNLAGRPPSLVYGRNGRWA